MTLRAIDGEAVLLDGDFREGERVVLTRMSLIGGGMKVRDLDSAKKRKTKPDSIADRPCSTGGKLKGAGEAKNSEKPAKHGKIREKPARNALAAYPR